MRFAQAILDSEDFMNFTWLSSIFTVLSFVVFVGILFWAYSRNNKERFEALGKLPIDNDNETIGN